MNLFLLNVLLALAWIALTGEFNPANFLFGYLIGFFFLWIIFRHQAGQRYFSRLIKIIEFVIFFLIELIIANLRIAWIVLSPKPSIQPGVIAVPLDLESEFEIALLTNLITLTPGTLALDVSSDKKVLFVHTVEFTTEEEFRRKIKDGFERRVMEIMR